MPRRLAQLIAVALVVVTLCTTAPAAERNIIVYITDDQSTTLGCYGDPVAKTPALDSLAADGTRFTHAFATTASCSASRSVVLSGLHNHKNGQYGHQHHYHKMASYPDVVSLALPRVLAGAGYRTARIGKYHVAPAQVYHFDQVLKSTTPGGGRNTVAMAEGCREFIEDASDDRPFFLYVATNDPHRSGGVDRTSPRRLKPNLFGNKPNRGFHAGVDEVYYNPADVPVPPFLPDTLETREELAQYYQSVARIDQGVARLVEVLKSAGVFDKTLILFTSDHGMAFAGAKTNVYEPALHVPFIVRNPYAVQRGTVTDALVSHIDITPSLVDFAGALDKESNGPKDWVDPRKVWKQLGGAPAENRSGGQRFNRYHGRSWLPVLDEPTREHHNTLFASHTFHEITMYYPMRVVRDRRYKLIWNLAYPLPYPFASDLWAASSWQAQLEKGPNAPYGVRTVDGYQHRPEFELFDLAQDPDEAVNLAADPRHAATLAEYQRRLRDMQQQLEDPWRMKWRYE